MKNDKYSEKVERVEKLYELLKRLRDKKKILEGSEPLEIRISNSLQVIYRINKAEDEGAYKLCEAILKESLDEKLEACEKELDSLLK